MTALNSAAIPSDSAERELFLLEGQASNRAIAIAADDFETVRKLGRESLNRLEAIQSESPSVLSRRGAFIHGANETLGIGAAELGAWDEAAAAFRAAESYAMEKSDTERSFSGVVGILKTSVTLDGKLATHRAWLAWVCAHQPGQAVEGVRYGKLAVDYYRRQIPESGDNDMILRLFATQAEVGLARAAIAAGDASVDAPGLLAAASTRLDSLPAEFRATSWVRQVQTKLAATRALLP